MSGSPDVLEYYRSKRASKPIRAIDLSECAVWRHVGPGFLRKEFQNNFVFIVKTTSRTFYLVAKTEVEMLVWVYSISQVCNLGQLEEGAGERGRGSGWGRGGHVGVGGPVAMLPTTASSVCGQAPRQPQPHSAFTASALRRVWVAHLPGSNVPQERCSNGRTWLLLISWKVLSISVFY